jgi:hypothetical protein
MAKNERTIRMASHILLRIFIPTETFSFTAKQSTNIQGSFPHMWKYTIFFASVVTITRQMETKTWFSTKQFSSVLVFRMWSPAYNIWGLSLRTHTNIACPSERRAIFNDLVKFAGLVKSSKLYLSCNGLRSHWIGTTCWKRHSLKREKNMEWFSCTIPLTLTVLKCYSNNKSECVCHNVIQ